MWSDEEISRILEIFPEALDSDVLIPRPPDHPLASFSKTGVHSPRSLKKPTSSGSDASKGKPGSDRQPVNTSLVDPIWENLDPTPDIRAMFTQFDSTFFDKKLAAVEVRWSPRMTLCAGLCCYEGRGGLCSIRLSEPLLKLRPRSDLVETLLHEMIHAFLFVTQNDRDRESHGPNFCSHMKRINSVAGTNITVFHAFHREVENYQKHWWRCTGVCRERPPYFGYVKRAMNRAPGPNDTWWGQHQAFCQGHFVKIKEPEKISTSKKGSGVRSGTVVKNSQSGKASTSNGVYRKKQKLENSSINSTGDIRSFLQDPAASATSDFNDIQNDRSDTTDCSPSSIDPPLPTESAHQWPQSGQVLGGVAKREESRLLKLNSQASHFKETKMATTSRDQCDEIHAHSSTVDARGSLVNPNLTTCPVCTILVPMSQINEHLDTCLS